MGRRAVFAGIALLCIGGAAAYVWQARSRAPASPPAAARPAAEGEVVASDGLLVFRVVSAGPDAGAVAIAPLADPEAARVVPGLRCERVHMAAGHGVCLVADRGFATTYRAVLFDRRFRATGELPLAGAPSRTQVSPDGRLAGTTVFVSGHSYNLGGFSTRTSILDLEAGRFLVEDLESFAVTRDGAPIQSPDFNFWGVTFTADGRSFYATLGTGDETLLVRAELAARRAEVIADAVECPSLSPDGRRIAYKHREGGETSPARWRIYVLDLGTRERRPLAETRNVDDQVQWLDDGHVLYALERSGPGRAPGTDEWVVPADGSGAPRLLLRDAYSAAVYRAAP